MITASGAHAPMVSVFISYAHADEKLKDRFLVHLGALKRERLIGVWHDGMLRPGEHLDRAIEAELAAADLIILLVSPDFINSDYCSQKEMQRAFTRAKDGRCRVVAVILKSCLWRDIPIDDEGGRLGDFVALPHEVVRSRQGRESALDSVVAGIRRLIKDKSESSAVVRSVGTRVAATVRTGAEYTCPICKRKAKLLDAIGDATGFECVNHDRFRVSGSVLSTPALRDAPRQKWETALRKAKARSHEGMPTITTYDFD